MLVGLRAMGEELMRGYHELNGDDHKAVPLHYALVCCRAEAVLQEAGLSVDYSRPMNMFRLYVVACSLKTIYEQES